MSRSEWRQSWYKWILISINLIRYVTRTRFFARLMMSNGDEETFFGFFFEFRDFDMNVERELRWMLGDFCVKKDRWILNFNFQLKSDFNLKWWHFDISIDPFRTNRKLNIDHTSLDIDNVWSSTWSESPELDDNEIWAINTLQMKNKLILQSSRVCIKQQGEESRTKCDRMKDMRALRQWPCHARNHYRSDIRA